LNRAPQDVLGRGLLLGVVRVFEERDHPRPLPSHPGSDRVDRLLRGDLTCRVAAEPVGDDVQSELVVEQERVLVVLPNPTDVSLSRRFVPRHVAR